MVGCEGGVGVAAWVLGVVGLFRWVVLEVVWGLCSVPPVWSFRCGGLFGDIRLRIVTSAVCVAAGLLVPGGLLWPEATVLLVAL